MTEARQFRCQPQSVTAARLFVRDRLSNQALETVEAAEVMTSELASNCVLHARTDFEVAIDSREQIRIELSDTGQGRPRLLSPTPRELTGRGLRIVEAMSEAWGVIAAATGKKVWFTLPQSHECGEELAPTARGSLRSGARRG